MPASPATSGNEGRNALRQLFIACIERALPSGARLDHGSVVLRTVAVRCELLSGRQKCLFRCRHALTSTATPRSPQEIAALRNRYREQPPKATHRLFAWDGPESVFVIGKSAEQVTCPECQGDSPTQCEDCSGVGKVGCKRCEGKGILVNANAIRACPDCHKGLVTCSGCGGKGTKSCGLCQNQHRVWEVYEVVFRDEITATPIQADDFARRFELWSPPKEFTVEKDAWGPPIGVEDGQDLFAQLLAPRSAQELAGFIGQERRRFESRLGSGALDHILQALQKADDERSYAVRVSALTCVTFRYTEDKSKKAAVGQVFFADGKPCRITYMEQHNAGPAKTCVGLGCGCLALLVVIGLIGAIFDVGEEGWQQADSEAQAEAARFQGSVISVRNGYALRTDTYALAKFTVVREGEAPVTAPPVGTAVRILREQRLIASGRIERVIVGDRADDGEKTVEVLAERQQAVPEAAVTITGTTFKAVVKIDDATWALPKDERELHIGDLVVIGALPKAARGDGDDGEGSTARPEASLREEHPSRPSVASTPAPSARRQGRVLSAKNAPDAAMDTYAMVEFIDGRGLTVGQAVVVERDGRMLARGRIERVTDSGKLVVKIGPHDWAPRLPREERRLEVGDTVYEQAE